MTHSFDLRSSTTGYTIDLAYLFLGTNGLPLAKDAYLPEQSLVTRVSWLIPATGADGRTLYDAAGNLIYTRDVHALYVFADTFSHVPILQPLPDYLRPDWTGQPDSLLSEISDFTIAGSTGASGGTGYMRLFGLDTPGRHFSQGLRDWGADGPPHDALANIAQAVHDNYAETLSTYPSRPLSGISRILVEGRSDAGLTRVVYTPDKATILSVGDMVHLNGPPTELVPDPGSPYVASAQPLYDTYRGEDVRIDLTDHVDDISAIWGFAARNLQIYTHDGDDVINLGWLQGNRLPSGVSALDLPQSLVIDTGAGNDVLNLSHVGAVTLQGGGGDDALWLDGGTVFDAARAGSLVSGGEGQDTLQGAMFGRNRLEGGGGNDAISGGAAADTIYGGAGDDVINGSAFVDPELRYGANDIEGDVLDGGIGNDTIGGSQKDDVIYGGAGDDYLYGDAQGGAGDDTIYGGAGHDTYYFEAPSSYRGQKYSHGFGHDVLHDTGGTLEFSTLYEINAGGTANPAFTRRGDDLRIAFPSFENSITLTSFYLNPTAWSVAGYDNEPVPFTLDTALGLASNRLSGTAGDDLLRGAPGTSALLGLGGNDTLLGMGLVESLQGGRGDDIISAAASRDLGRDAGGSIYRLYQATLDRMPDATGYGTWLAQVQTGHRTLTEIAQGFVASAEFQKSYGTLSNMDFVTLLYQNVLGRAPSLSGAASWTAELEAGVSRASVVTGFSESPEFKAQTNSLAAAYVDAKKAAGWADDVYRLYMATLDRAPDLKGLQDWSLRLSQGSTLESVAAGFTGSAEFQAKYGSLSSGAFVELLYQNVLNRPADAKGLASWVAQLGAGTSREKVVLGFSQSPEFVNRTAGGFEDRMERFEGAQIEGGAGNDVLIGSLLSDTFQFALEDKGSDRVLDLTIWDRLEFDGFGYEDRTDVMAHFTRSGDHLIFADRGVRVVFENVASGLIGEVEFIL